VSRLAAVVRWRLATTAVSLRLVPPGLALVALLLMVLTQRPQPLGSMVAAAIVIVFALSAWLALAHTSALAPGHRAVTQVTVGATPAFAGELAAGLILVAGTVAIVLAWPVAVVRAVPDVPGPLVLVACYAVVTATGAAGLAAGTLADALGLRAPVRFVVTLALVSLALARPALTDGRHVLGPVAAVAAPAVLDAARAANGDEPPGGPAAAVACLAWAAAASVLAWGLRVRRAPVERAT
jgi:hypothetical protein